LQGKAFILGRRRLSFASSNDVPLATTLLIKHLFIAKEDARSVALHD